MAAVSLRCLRHFSTYSRAHIQNYFPIVHNLDSNQNYHQLTELAKISKPSKPSKQLYLIEIAKKERMQNKIIAIDKSSPALMVSFFR